MTVLANQFKCVRATRFVTARVSVHVRAPFGAALIDALGDE